MWERGLESNSIVLASWSQSWTRVDVRKTNPTSNCGCRVYTGCIYIIPKDLPVVFFYRYLRGFTTILCFRPNLWFLKMGYLYVYIIFTPTKHNLVVHPSMRSKDYHGHGKEGGRSRWFQFPGWRRGDVLGWRWELVTRNNAYKWQNLFQGFPTKIAFFDQLRIFFHSKLSFVDGLPIAQDWKRCKIWAFQPSSWPWQGMCHAFQQRVPIERGKLVGAELK